MIRIRFRDHYSDYFTLHAGVPQGSVLSPTLYILYTNDLPEPLYPTTLTLSYADDITQLAAHGNIRFPARRTQREVDRIAAWELLWRIKTNPNKSKITYFHRRCGVPAPVELKTSTSRTFISRSPSTVTLGVTLDTSLTLKTHITAKTGMAGIALSRLNKLRVKLLHLFVSFD